jgi:hypothetical protein
MEKIGVNTINTSLGGDKTIKEKLPTPNKVVSPFIIMNKPIITFYEPFEILIKQTEKYLQETKMTENELLEKYDIDYDSFFSNNIRDEKGLPEILNSKHDIHIFLLDYINYSNKNVFN